MTAAKSRGGRDNTTPLPPKLKKKLTVIHRVRAYLRLLLLQQLPRIQTLIIILMHSIHSNNLIHMCSSSWNDKSFFRINSSKRLYSVPVPLL
jgi:hypothetical protein